MTLLFVSTCRLMRSPFLRLYFLSSSGSWTCNVYDSPSFVLILMVCLAASTLSTVVPVRVVAGEAANAITGGQRLNAKAIKRFIYTSLLFPLILHRTER